MREVLWGVEMKVGLKDIVGKRIAGVVVAENDAESPRHQVFLVFPDGTYFELYGDEFSCCAGIDRGGMGDVRRYVGNCGATVRAVYPEAPPATQP